MYLDLKPISVITNVSDLDRVRILSSLPILPKADTILQAFVFYLTYLADILTYFSVQV